MRKYNNYGEVAIRAIQIYEKESSLEESWNLAAREIFDSESSQKKSCPKSAFLGLCEEGLIKGVTPSSYLKSKKTNLNKKYAIIALKLLSKNTNLTKKELWNKVKEELFLGEKSHNSQMDVVFALHNNKFILKK